MRFGRRPLPILVALVIVLIALPALAAVPLTRVSQDPYTNAASQHQTEVEPDTFAFGNTIVSAFQVGRVFGGGAANIGWATSTNGGQSWTNGFLPATTGQASPVGFATPVVPGRNPLVQFWPPSTEAAQPMLADPPPKTRPTWKAEMIVEPKLKVSGSTSVWCWLAVLV